MTITTDLPVFYSLSATPPNENINILIIPDEVARKQLTISDDLIIIDENDYKILEKIMRLNGTWNFSIKPVYFGKHCRCATPKLDDSNAFTCQNCFRLRLCACGQRAKFFDVFKQTLKCEDCHYSGEEQNAQV